MALYVPPTDESDHKKQNQSLQLIGGVTSTNTDNITTNTASIVTNTSAIATLVAGPLTTGNVATQADQETSTSTTLAVTPGRQQYHPSASKAWVKFTGSGSNGAQAIGASYNVASVSRTAQGVYTITFTIAFSSANYVAIVNNGAEAVTNGWGQVSTMAAGSFVANFLSSAAAAIDPPRGYVVCFGDQ